MENFLDENLSKEFNVAYVAFLNSKNEFEYFKKIMLNIKEKISKNIHLFLVAAVQDENDLIDFYRHFKSIKTFQNMADEEFLNIVNKIELGIVNSLESEIITDGTLFLTSRKIPVLAPVQSGDSLLSTSDLFRYENSEAFVTKLEALVSNKELLKDYFKNLDEVTLEFLKESSKYDERNSVLISNEFLLEGKE